jgi:hypothetical protein
VAPRGRKLAAVPDEKTSGPMLAGVRETLDRLDLKPEDAALKVLAAEYAATMDRAAAIAARLAKLPPDPDFAEELQRLRQRVSAQVTVSDLGPKLLAALDALGATPKARSTAGKPAPAGQKSKLTGLRSELGA